MYIHIYITSCAYKNSIFLIAISYHNGTRPICSLIPSVSGLVRPSFSGHGACWYLGWTFTPHLLGWTTKDWYGLIWIDMDWYGLIWIDDHPPIWVSFFFLRTYILVFSFYVHIYIYISYTHTQNPTFDNCKSRKTIAMSRKTYPMVSRTFSAKVGEMRILRDITKYSFIYATPPQTIVLSMEYPSITNLKACTMWG